MRRHAVIVCCVLLSACAASRVAPTAMRWEQRAVYLQHADDWQMDGRAAVAFGKQGWQATLSWRQSSAAAEVHLSGPFGIGAVVLQRSADGLSMNGAPPSDAVVRQLQDKLGFDLPIDDLRYWLLGVPNPGLAADVIRNEQDRAQRVIQDGWAVDYDRYSPVNHDVLPAHIVLSRDTVRVRVIVDHWSWR